MKKLVLILGFMSALMLNAQHSGDKIDEQDRKAYISKAMQDIENLESFSSIGELQLRERTTGEGLYYDCKVFDEGILMLQEGSFIYIKCHSAHENEAVGDVSLATDEKGRIFQNNGHICGGVIHFISPVGIEKPAGSEDFFGHFFSDTDDEKWFEITP